MGWFRISNSFEGPVSMAGRVEESVWEERREWMRRQQESGLSAAHRLPADARCTQLPAGKLGFVAKQNPNQTEASSAAFERVLREAVDRMRTRLLSHRVMPNRLQRSRTGHNFAEG